MGVRALVSRPSVGSAFQVSEVTLQRLPSSGHLVPSCAGFLGSHRCCLQSAARGVSSRGAQTFWIRLTSAFSPPPPPQNMSPEAAVAQLREVLAPRQLQKMWLTRCSRWTFLSVRSLPPNLLVVLLLPHYFCPVHLELYDSSLWRTFYVLLVADNKFAKAKRTGQRNETAACSPSPRRHTRATVVTVDDCSTGSLNTTTPYLREYAKT